jgi:hypothetical protein
MVFKVDADIALFAVRHKLEKEFRTYLYLRELAKGKSGYICRISGAKAVAEKYKQGYSTSQRHIKALIEMGWITKVRHGNIHINGILRIKAILSAHIEGFHERKRVFYIEDSKKEKYYNGRLLLHVFKSALTSGLTHDKLRRNEKKILKSLSVKERKNKAVIGTALEKDPQRRAYAFSLKATDWAMGLGTVQIRKQVAETERFEWYRWNELGGKMFTSEREAIQFGNAHISNFNRGYLKRRYKSYLVCTGEDIFAGSNRIELGFRNQSTNLADDLLTLTLSGKVVNIKVEKIKPLRSPKPQKNLFIEDFRPFTGRINSFCSDF